MGISRGARVYSMEAHELYLSKCDELYYLISRTLSSSSLFVGISRGATVYSMEAHELYSSKYHELYYLNLTNSIIQLSFRGHL